MSFLWTWYNTENQKNNKNGEKFPIFIKKLSILNCEGRKFEENEVKIMNKSAKEYIADNDFEGAKVRFEGANARWKDYWFETCITIFESSVQWAKKYTIDVTHQLIVKVKEKVKRVYNTIKNKGKSHTYIIKMFDTEGEWAFTKIGKADDVETRMNSFVNHEYKRDNITIAYTEPIKIYTLPNDDLAEAFESLIKNFLRKMHAHIPNDRFEPFNPTEEDFNQFDKIYNTVMSLA